MTKKQQILSLRAMGYSYRQISENIPCSKSLIAYYLGDGQKEKTYARVRKCKANRHPFAAKISTYCCERNYNFGPNSSNGTYKYKQLLRDKIKVFSKKDNKYMKPTFTVEDVIAKFGENPVCYLTGLPIDIYKPRTYEFDHKIPRSRGGDNSIENLGICTKQSNRAKRDMTPDEFINLCKLVVEYKGG